MRNLFIVAAAALITVGCSDSPTAPDPTPMPTPTPAATFSDVQSQVFNASCVICHGSPATAGLDLRSPQSFANLVNVGSPVSGISFVGGIHLTGVAQIPSSPGPIRGWALQAPVGVLEWAAGKAAGPEGACVRSGRGS